MAEPLTATPVRPASLPERLATLPKYYSYRDVLELVFAGDLDGFTDAVCDGTLSPMVIAAVLDTAPPRTLEILLLRRIVRLLAPQPRP